MANTANTKTSKAVKAGLLACSAETLGNEAEAVTAATTAGRLARREGLTLDALHAALGTKVATADLAWNYMVDGWYEAA
ncbi:MAG TPA: hypothetical protein VN253_04580 [Kofleriaceae bacterium]|nr:hypothetical protein [Kofleriaceae bacterium]